MEARFWLTIAYRFGDGGCCFPSKRSCSRRLVGLGTGYLVRRARVVIVNARIALIA
jgi:hypothetical protein